MYYNKYFFSLLALLAVSFWGLSYIWTKIVFEFYHPITTIFLRLSISSLLLFPILALAGRSEKISPDDYIYFVLLSFFSPFCYFLFESFGLKHASPTLASVIIATIPIFAPFVGYAVYSEKITGLNIAGFVVSFTGVIIMVFDFETGFRASPIGVLLLFMAVMSALVYLVFLKKMALKYSPFTIVKMQNLLGTLMFLPLFIIFDLRHFVSVVPTAETLWALAKLGIFASTLAFIFHTIALKNLGIAKTAIFSNFIPVFTAVFAFVILGEKLNITNLIGILIVITGVALTQITGINRLIKRAK